MEIKKSHNRNLYLSEILLPCDETGWSRAGGKGRMGRLGRMISIEDI
jgi:hypothetical protein